MRTFAIFVLAIATAVTSAPPPSETDTDVVVNGFVEYVRNHVPIASLMSTETPTDDAQRAALEIFHTHRKSIGIRTAVAEPDRILPIFHAEYELTNETMSAIASFASQCSSADESAEKGVMTVLQLNPYSSMVIVNTAVITCTDLWMQSLVTSRSTFGPSPPASVQAMEDVLIGNSTATTPAFNILLWLTATAVGRETGAVPQPPHEPMLLGVMTANKEEDKSDTGLSFKDFLSNVDLGVTTYVKAFKEIVSLFHTKTTSKIIKEQTCMSFNTFSSDCTVTSMECYPDEFIDEWVDATFKDLVKITGDKALVRQKMLAFMRTGSINETERDTIELTNTDKSMTQVYTVHKVHDAVLPCSHWVVVKCGTVFTLAPDLIYWETSKTSLFKSSTKVSIQKVPHRISFKDIMSIKLLSDLFINEALARTRGIPFTVPEFPECNNNKVMLAAIGPASSTPTTSTAIAPMIASFAVPSAEKALSDQLKPMKVQAPKTWKTLMQAPTTKSFGVQGPVVIRNDQDVSKFVAPWQKSGVPKDDCDYAARQIKMLANRAVQSGLFHAMTVNIRSSSAVLQTITLVMRSFPEIEGGVVCWSYGMSTNAKLIQQTTAVPWEHCSRSGKCAWLRKCSCRRGVDHIPRSITTQELVVVLQRLKQDQYTYWTSHKPKYPPLQLPATTTRASLAVASVSSTSTSSNSPPSTSVSNGAIIAISILVVAVALLAIRRRYATKTITIAPVDITETTPLTNPNSNSEGYMV